MQINIHPHAREGLKERGATEDEIRKTVLYGETFPAKYGRTGFRYNFVFDDTWREKHYQTKQVEVHAVKEDEN